MQRQLQLMQDVIERERRVQKQLAGLVLGPVDTLFQLLEETGTMLRSQAQELENAGRALEHTAGLMKTQAELFERSIGALREPVDLARAATGLERRARKSSARQPRRTRPRG
jgi:ABC-type transporter Mla subunit MlaD